MKGLTIRAADSCRYDVVALGEVMLRLDPGEGRVRTTRTFTVSEGGGEYNVGRALRRCFEHRVALVTALGESEVGRLLEDLLLQGGVDLDHVVWRTTDEVGRQHRTPLNFTERGHGVRQPVGVYDRAHSAAASMMPEDVEWDRLFGELGVRWFHTGGIFAGLSTTTFETALAAMRSARSHGTIVSYDINYRPSLWRAAGGPDAAWQVTAQLLDEVDVLFGVDGDDFAHTANQLGSHHRSLAVIATPTRRVHSASKHDWSGRIWTRNEGVMHGAEHEALAILDRVGGGDGFAAGVVHGLLEGRTPGEALALGVALGALVMTTPGDTSMVSAAEVQRLVDGDDRSIRR